MVQVEVDDDVCVDIRIWQGNMDQLKYTDKLFYIGHMLN